MSADLLLSLVQDYGVLPSRDAGLITAAWGSPVARPPSEVLLEPGRVCRDLFFLDDGFARFYTETEASDVTRHFVVPGLLFTAYDSFDTGSPSRDGLQTLTAARVRRLGREANEALAASSPAWDAFRRAYVRDVYVYLDEALGQARVLSALERYEAFLHDYPDILLHVPLRYVASYLGMTPQSLSRVRARTRGS